MKFAAIADVHGNCPALEAVLADIASLGINEVVNLGDHVSGPLEAARTADLLIERGFPSVRGDQDRILVELWQAGTSARSDFRQLERKHFDWMASMPPTLMHREEVFLCHASPRDDTAFWIEYVTIDGGVRAVRPGFQPPRVLQHQVCPEVRAPNRHRRDAVRRPYRG